MGRARPMQGRGGGEDKQDADMPVYSQMPRKVEMYAVNRANGARFVFFFFGC